MNEQLQKVLADLAAKFGTSVEHLWKVMIYQARISVVIDVIQYLIIIIVGVILFRLHLRFNKQTNAATRVYSTCIYEESDATCWIMVISGTVWLILALIAFLSIGDSITAAFNPEYWALKQIIK